MFYANATSLCFDDPSMTLNNKNFIITLKLNLVPKRQDWMYVVLKLTWTKLDFGQECLVGWISLYFSFFIAHFIYYSRVSAAGGGRHTCSCLCVCAWACMYLAGWPFSQCRYQRISSSLSITWRALILQKKQSTQSTVISTHNRWPWRFHLAKRRIVSIDIISLFGSPPYLLYCSMSKRCIALAVNEEVKQQHLTTLV